MSTPTETESKRERSWIYITALVVLGVLVAMVLFARRVAHFTNVTRRIDGDTAHYDVEGELFFASSNDLVHQFDDVGDPATVIIDLSEATVWDASTVATLDAIETRYAAKGKRAIITGLDGHSAARRDRLAGHLGAGH